MHYTTLATLALAALNIGEVVAGPAHAHMHQKKEVSVDYVAAYWRGIAAEKTAAPAAPSPAPVPNAKAVAEPASSSSNSGLLNGIVGASNGLTAFGKSSIAPGQALQVGDSAVNNYGSPYGSNIIKVPSRTGYDFTNEFKNTQKVPITVNVWNKVGPDLQPLSGAMLAPKNTSLTFVLPPNSSQIVAFQGNSQVGWAEAVDKVLQSGQFDTTIGEANFKPTGSGYDVSVIPKSDKINNYDMEITSTEAPACTSNRFENFWLTPTDPVGNSDGSCFANAKTASLTTILGGTV